MSHSCTLLLNRMAPHAARHSSKRRRDEHDGVAKGAMKADGGENAAAIRQMVHKGLQFVIKVARYAQNGGPSAVCIR